MSTAAGHSLRAMAAKSDDTRRPSYSVNILYRIEMMRRVMRDMQTLVNRMRRRLQENISEREESDRMRCTVETLQIRVRLLREELAKTVKRLNYVKYERSSFENDLYERSVEMSSRFQQLKHERELLFERRRKFNEEREKLLKANAQLLLRQRELITEVVNIYRISPSSKQNDAYSICDVHLPNSEDFGGHDLTMISVALGYVCHCLLILSRFLDIPLRYSIIYYGSRSVVVDHVNQKIADSERIFPTFVKSSGKERVHFDYGVYLINRNIAQMRQNVGMNTTDLRKTLPNLYSLLQEKLILKNRDEIDSTVKINTWPNFDSSLQRELELMSKTQNLVTANPFLPSNIVSAMDKALSVSLDKGLNELGNVKQTSPQQPQQHRRTPSSDYPSTKLSPSAYNFSEPQLSRINSSNGHSSNNASQEWISKQQNYSESVSSDESTVTTENRYKEKVKFVIAPSPSNSLSSEHSKNNND